MKCHITLVTDAAKKAQHLPSTFKMLLQLLFLMILVPTTTVNGRIIYGSGSLTSASLMNPLMAHTKIAPQLTYKRDNLQFSIAAASNRDRDLPLKSYNLLAFAREDICKHCICSNNNKLRSVHCDYRTNRTLSQVLGSNFEIPIGVNSILINLASNTRFELRGGLFRKNIVNSFIIEGLKADDQVEFAQNAFLGNKGGYPDIRVNNVKTVFVRQNAFSAGEIKFTVQNCDNLNLFTDAFTNVNMTGNFVGIADMTIHEKAFNSAHAKLRIENAGISEITRFEASVHEIRFIDCRIGVIKRYTFDVTNINYIVFEDCQIETIETRAITDKLHSDHVSITNAVIGVIDSEAIYGSGISELLLTNNTITSINDRAISVHSVNVTIAQNEIKHLGSDWLTVKDWAKIIVEQNKFGTFGNMALQMPQQPADCSFSSNSVTDPQPGSLNMTNCRIHEISIKKPCTCNLEWLKSLSDHDLRSETYCTVDQTLQYCFNATSFNTLKYVSEVCDEKKLTLDCGANGRIKKVDGRFFTPEELAKRRNNGWPVMLSVLSTAVVASIFIVTCCIYWFCCRKTNCATRLALRLACKGDGSDSNQHAHVFSPEDRHIIEKTMNVIAKNYPAIYRSIKVPLKLLLREDISESKCIDAITKIVTVISRTENRNCEFLDFNRVLTDHLQLCIPSAPPIDPIYTEPGTGGPGPVINNQMLSSLHLDALNVNAGAPLGSPLTDGGDFYSSSILISLPRYIDDEYNLPLAGTNGNRNGHTRNNNNSSSNNNNNNNNNATGNGNANANGTVTGVGNGNANGANNTGGSLGMLGRNLPPEHIYAEPNCAQQPLLRNEYASPADRHLESMDLYSEPINDRGGTMLPAYAQPGSDSEQPSSVKTLVSSGGAVVIGGPCPFPSRKAAVLKVAADTNPVSKDDDRPDARKVGTRKDFNREDNSDDEEDYDSDTDEKNCKRFGIPKSNVSRLARNFIKEADDLDGHYHSYGYHYPKITPIYSTPIARSMQYVSGEASGPNNAMQMITSSSMTRLSTSTDGSGERHFVVSSIIPEVSEDEADNAEITPGESAPAALSSEYSGGSADTFAMDEVAERHAKR